MSFKRTIVAVATVGALTAATAVPAMALENEFHGLYRFRAIVSNFDDSAAGAVAIGAETGATNGGKTPLTNTYMEQRARLMYIAKANDDLKLVTHFEFDSRFGDTSYNQNATNTTNNGSATRNAGGGIGADQTNLETKNIYLDFKIPSTPVQMKVGIQGFTDNYKGIIFNNDAAGIVATSKFGAASFQAGYFRFDDATTGGSATTATNAYLGVPSVAPTTTYTSTSTVVNPTTVTTTTTASSAIGASVLQNAQLGNNTRDFMTVGGKFSLTKDLTFGADYYLLYSDVLRRTQVKTYVNMIGANAEAKLGPATVNGFAMYQFGRLGNGVIGQHQDLSAFAGNLAGKIAVGPGTAKITGLFISGDKQTTGTGERNDFQTIMERGTTTSGHTFYEANSQLLLRNIYAPAATDRAVVYDLNNNGRGLIAVFGGYDLAMGKFFSNSNVGIGAVAKDNGNANNGGKGSGSSNVLGTEINTETGYKLYDNLTASLNLAYLFLGDFYNVAGGKADNPYSTKIMLNYTF
jgi:hypothetical protein